MTDAEKLAKLKELYDGEEPDNILLDYLTMAGEVVINKCYPFRTDITVVPERYENIQLEITIFFLNKQGAEGESSHNENGIQRSYEKASVPNSILNRIMPFAGVL